jgi:hypothetical protein
MAPERGMRWFGQTRSVILHHAIDSDHIDEGKLQSWIYGSK